MLKEWKRREMVESKSTGALSQIHNVFTLYEDAQFDKYEYLFDFGNWYIGNNHIKCKQISIISPNIGMIDYIKIDIFNPYIVIGRYYNECTILEHLNKYHRNGIHVV